ncbi:MAG TPA: class I SAM-dependent methyltransferase, partial [Chloroflexota bacterium]|nr:class I SAM-dependent methyltransferase [Chloroflexota bacterium]
AGVQALLKPAGVASFEFPYLKDMLDELEFDTIYHEHQCYYSLTALNRLFASHGLQIFDVLRVPIHGGSLRIFACHAGARPIAGSVKELLAEENAWGAATMAPYERFAGRVEQLRTALVELLDSIKARGQRIAAYGAAAKGVTLASYCGIGKRQLDYVVDRSTYKQGRLFPIDGLPIYPTEKLAQDAPDYALLFTWNFVGEIIRQQDGYLRAGGRFIVPVPNPRLVGVAESARA